MGKISVGLSLVLIILSFAAGYVFSSIKNECDFSALDLCMEELKELKDEIQRVETDNQKLDEEFREMYLQLEKLDSDYQLEVTIGDSTSKSVRLAEIVTKMDSIILATNKKLEELQKNGNNSSVHTLKRTLNELRAQLKEKELEIERLRNDNDVYQYTVDAQIVELRKIKSEKDSLSTEIDELETVLRDLNELIEYSESIVSDTIGGIYLDYGKELVFDFENTKGGFLGSNSKLKKNLMSNALKCFKISCEYNNSEAPKWIVKLLTDPKFNKYVSLSSGIEFDISQPCRF